MGAMHRQWCQRMTTLRSLRSVATPSALGATCRQAFGHVEVASYTAQRAITARKALRSELRKNGVRLDALLPRHRSNVLAHLLTCKQARDRAALKARAEAPAAPANLPQALSASQLNFKKMRTAVGLDSPTELARVRELATQWQAADPYSLIQGAAARLERNDGHLARAQRQLPPLVREVYAVRGPSLDSAR